MGEAQCLQQTASKSTFNCPSPAWGVGYMILPKTEGFRPSDAAEYGVLPVTFEDIWLVSSTLTGKHSTSELVLYGAKGVVSHQNIW